MRNRDARDILRTFAPLDSHNLPLLRWDTELDQEDGAGVNLVLLDSGIAWMHSVFRGAHLGGRDFTGSGELIDGTGHGTRSAALIVGQDLRYVQGIAPACQLLVAKVLHRGGRGRGDEAVVRAIDWAVDRGADIIVMPLGRGPDSQRVIHAVRRALQAGCQLYAAAGNRGPEVLAFPASIPGVTAVSAVDTMGRPLHWCCQSRHVSCYAPGEAIWSTGPSLVSGTSLATVIAAGVTVLQIARRRRLQIKGDNGADC